jgi:hypothetical protein
MKFSRRARSSYLRIFVSLYQGIGLSMYLRIKYGIGKPMSGAHLRSFHVKTSALAGVESKAAIPTQGRDDLRVIPQRHGAVSA